MSTKKSNKKLSVKWRKLLLPIHVVVSVSVIGADLTIIILGITGLTSEIPELIHASYLAMELLVDTAIVPLALGALLTGVLLGVVSKWGLMRYYWVLTKLVLTLVVITAVVFVLRPKINQVATEVLQVPLADLSVIEAGPIGIAMIIGPLVAVLILITVAILGIYKPWGQTRRISSFTWISVITILVFAQKLLPVKTTIDVPIALMIIRLGILIFLASSMLPGLAPHIFPNRPCG